MPALDITTMVAIMMTPIPAYFVIAPLAIFTFLILVSLIRGIVPRQQGQISAANVPLDNAQYVAPPAPPIPPVPPSLGNPVGYVQPQMMSAPLQVTTSTPQMAPQQVMQPTPQQTVASAPVPQAPLPPRSSWRPAPQVMEPIAAPVAPSAQAPISPTAPTA